MKAAPLLSIPLLLMAVSGLCDSLPKELYMATDVGHVTLTVKPCTTEVKDRFPYEAYATDGKDVHPGCWRMEDQATVAIYFPEINATAVYKAALFKRDKGSI